MKTKNTTFQKLLEAASVLALVAMGVILLVFWGRLPQQVPLHYNFYGEIDRWCSKYEMLVCPLGGVGLFALLTLISRTPKLWNMAVEPARENKEQLYALTKEMLQVLKLEVMLLFCYLFYCMATMRALSSLFLPLELTVIFGTLAYYIYKQVQLDRSTKRTIRIDSEVARLKKTFPVSRYWLVLPVALALLPYVFVATDKARPAPLYAVLISAEVLPFCVMYFHAAGAKSTFYSENEALNMALNRLRVRAWTGCWVGVASIAAVNGVVCFGILQANGYLITPPVVMVYCVHVVVALVVCNETRLKIRAGTRALLGEGKAPDEGPP